MLGLPTPPKGKKYKFFCGKINVQQTATQLEYANAFLVKIQNRLTNADGSANAFNLFYGDAFEQAHELTPGVFSEWIAVSNVRDVRVVCPAGTCTVAYTAITLADAE